MIKSVKNLIKNLIIYISIACLAILGFWYYQDVQKEKYIEHFKGLGGNTLVLELTDTYKGTIEMYSNYKLNREMKKKTIDKLLQINKKLHNVELRLNKKPAEHLIDFSYIYHDIKLVAVSLADVTKDDFIPIVILHAIEGIGDLKKEVTYIQYR